MDVELGQAEGREGVDPAQLQGSAVGESSPLSVTGAVGLVDAGLPLPFTLSSAHSPRTTPTPPPRSSIEQPTLRQPVHRPHRHRLGCHPPIFLRSSSASPTPLCRSAELPRPLLPPLPPLLTAPPLNRLSTAASPMDNSRGQQRRPYPQHRPPAALLSPPQPPSLLPHSSPSPLVSALPPFPVCLSRVVHFLELHFRWRLPSICCRCASRWWCGRCSADLHFVPAFR